MTLNSFKKTKNTNTNRERRKTPKHLENIQTAKINNFKQPKLCKPTILYQTAYKSNVSTISNVSFARLSTHICDNL